MRRFSNIDWRAEIERSIEERVRQEELKQLFSKIDEVLRDVEVSKEPAWRPLESIEKRGRTRCLSLTPPSMQAS